MMKTDVFTLFLTVFEYSIILSIQIVFLLCLRPAIRHWFGAVKNYWLWLLPLCWLPMFWLGQTFNIPQIITNSMFSLDMGETVTKIWFGQVFSGIGFGTGYSLLPDMNAAPAGFTDTGYLIAIVWLSVAFALLINQIFTIKSFAQYVRFNSLLVPDHEQTLVRDDALQFLSIKLAYLDGIRSPALYGIFRPVLLLPSDFLSSYDKDQRHIMLSHEWVHLSRHDNLCNLVAAFLKILFWFNPLVHLGHYFYRLDQEVSCDAQALRRCNVKQARVYAHTLLATISQDGIPALSPNMTAWDNPGQFKERITMLNKHNTHTNRTLTTVITFVLVCLAGTGLTACAVNSPSSRTQAGQQTDSRDVPPDARRQDIVSRLVVARINEFVALRDAGDFSAAMDKLDELKARYDAGRMNTRETFLLWNMYANLFEVQGQTENALDFYETLLAMPALSSEQRESVESRVRRLFAGGTIGARDSDLAIKPDEIEMLPIVTIQPLYPQNALNSQTEGWILLSFTVDEEGDVMNPVVVDAEPESVFDSSALSAVSKFKFAPREIDGSPVQVDGVRYLFRYSL